MYPIALDLTKISVLLAGRGELLLRRIAQLDEAKAGHLVIYSDDTSEEIKKAAGKRLVTRLPEAGDINQATVVLAGGLSPEESRRIAAQARTLGKLVNIEDVNELCDFYFTANLRRGDLVIAVSTSGASPTLARKVRDAIGKYFGDEWSDRTREIAELRRKWKDEGKTMREVLSASEAHIADQGWLE